MLQIYNYLNNAANFSTPGADFTNRLKSGFGFGLKPDKNYRRLSLSLFMKLAPENLSTLAVALSSHYLKPFIKLLIKIQTVVTAFKMKRNRKYCKTTNIGCYLIWLFHINYILASFEISLKAFWR